MQAALQAQEDLETLTKLRQSGSIVYCSVTETEAQPLMTMILDDHSVAVFEFTTGKLTQGLRIPLALDRIVNEPLSGVLTKLKSFSNRLSRGMKMYDLINSAIFPLCDFEMAPVVMAKGNSGICTDGFCFLVQQPGMGQVLMSH